MLHMLRCHADRATQQVDTKRDVVWQLDDKQHSIINRAITRLLQTTPHY